MKQIRAFVGHSFTEEDGDLVGKFTKFFDQLAQLESNFSWVHAEAAEPKELAAKVMALFQDRNLLIGICTRKEWAVAADALRSSWWLPRKVWGNREACEWKTSDWIIQEIGLAKGRDADVLLLLEEGVRAPRGLLGDLEYIVFERASPERSFGKIVEMITALSPRSPLLATDDATPSTALSETRDAPPAPSSETRKTPTNDWKRPDYEREIMLAIGYGDTERIKLIGDSFLASELGSKADARASWSAYVEYTRIWWEKGGELSKLKRLAEEHQTNADVLSYLARAYTRYDEHTKAGATWMSAAEVSADIDERSHFLRKAATEYQKAGLADLSASVISTMRELETDEVEADILLAQRDIAEATNDPDVFIGALERLLEIDPSNNDLRFSLAYKYAGLGHTGLAMAHYSSIRGGERNGVTWNNLGVAFDGLELPAASVSAYREAEKLGETLAMSNLANKLLGSGFLGEAEELCSTATNKPDYHKNVARTISRLKEIPDEEEKKKQEILDNIRPTREFYRRFGGALSQLQPADVSGRWKGPNYGLDLVTSDSTFTATGLYDVLELGGLGRALLTIDGAKDPPTKFRVTYKGKFIGCALAGIVTRVKDGGKPPSLLGSEDSETKVLMVLSSDRMTLRVMEVTSKDRFRFYDILRTP